ncbi:MAG: hypothetical protein K2N23_05865 [Clostridia bacterium]|nr:hypothetical protein [Clostridia bacterium]
MIFKKSDVHPVIKDDIQRYKKNKLASMLAILGLVLCCAYFVVLYAQVKNGNYYYKWPIALDVIFNLIFLLFVFLLSEQVKNYNRKLFWLQMFLGVMQIVRIFWLPLAGVTETVYPKLVGIDYPGKVLSSGAFICMVVFLAGSSACVIASGIVGFIRSLSLEKFTKKLASGEISVEATLKELDEADEKKASEMPAEVKAEEVTNA